MDVSDDACKEKYLTGEKTIETAVNASGGRSQAIFEGVLVFRRGNSSLGDARQR